MTFVPESATFDLLLAAICLALLFSTFAAVAVFYFKTHSEATIAAAILLFAITGLLTSAFIKRDMETENREDLTVSLAAHYGASIRIIEKVDFDNDVVRVPVIADDEKDCTLVRDGSAFRVLCGESPHTVELPLP